MFQNMSVDKSVNYQVAVALDDFKSRFRGSFKSGGDINFICLNTRFYDADLARACVKVVNEGMDGEPAETVNVYQNMSIDAALVLLNQEN